MHQLFSPFYLFLAFCVQLQSAGRYSKACSLCHPRVARHTDQAFPFLYNRLPYPRRAGPLLRLHHHRGSQKLRQPDGGHGDRGMVQYYRHLTQPR